MNASLRKVNKFTVECQYNGTVARYFSIFSILVAITQRNTRNSGLYFIGQAICFQLTFCRKKGDLCLYFFF